MENTYSVTIKESSKELTKRERIQMKDTSEALSIDEISQSASVENGFVTIDPAAYVVLTVHNSKASEPEYDQYLILDRDGNTYYTGSTSFWNSFINIWEEMAEEDPENFEPFQIKVVRKKSNNYTGKEFLKAVLI